MKILIIMDPGILVPPKGYGGHERLVYLFSKEYSKLGHEVHLLVTKGSEIEGCIVHGYGEEGFPQNSKQVRKGVMHAWRFVWKHRNDFDLIHNFGRLLYLLPVLNHPVKKIMTYGREISLSNIRYSVKLPNKNLVFTGCSNDLIRRRPLPGRWLTVYNAIDFSRYEVQPQCAPDAPLIFLGRIERVKGCHTAIEVAKRTGNKLIIAGNISPLPDEQAYFNNEIRPLIDDDQIVHVGQVNDEQKNFYLRKAKALLFPIEWDEPFGIVMIEAMACGTPVLAFKKGSVNEVVQDGVTGYKVSDIEEMINAVARVSDIDRLRCRNFAQELFNATRIAKQYLSLFEPAGRSKRIVIVTTGQPAANPRVLKEYETLKKAGYQTKVLYTYSAEWSHRIDEDKFRTMQLSRSDFKLVGGSIHVRKLVYLLTRIGHKIFVLLGRIFPSAFIKDMSMVRSSMALWMAAHRYKADLYIAHYVGALPAAAHAARVNRALYAFDAEDFHRGEPEYYLNQKMDIVDVENRYLPSTSFISAASPLIAEAYRQHYPASKVITLNNVFSKSYLVERRNVSDNGLSLFWFSQNIGPQRGLEIIIEAMNHLPDDVSLYLLGNNKNEQYYQGLISLSRRPGNIHLMQPVSPEKVFDVAANFDIGLASEVPLSENRNLCLTNKIFTYLLAGNCILASDTAAQKGFMEKYPGIGLLYASNDPQNLADKIRLLYNDRALMRTYQQNSIVISKNILNWENESEILLSMVHSVI